jgi:hypothetical protein
MAANKALCTAGAVRTRVASPTPFAPKGPAAFLGSMRKKFTSGMPTEARTK